MKISELLLEDNSIAKPIVYVDMDGVLADLYNHAAEILDVDHYNDMTKDEWETFFRDSDAYHLFRDIPPFSNANQLLDIVKKYAGGYRILSSPLGFDREGSIKGKREWLAKHIKVPADKIVFEHDKWHYAKQANGTPNILIDDYGVNTRKWDDAGGIACKYKADEDSLDKVVGVLKQVYGDK